MAYIIRIKIVTLIAFALLTACSKKEDLQGFNEFVKSQRCLWNKNLTTVVMKDIFTPPVASRIYVYANIASYEASISRLYGGIHYRPAIENGQKQGRVLAEFILGRIRTREDKQAYKSY